MRGKAIRIGGKHVAHVASAPVLGGGLQMLPGAGDGGLHSQSIMPISKGWVSSSWVG
jgi:hypothetical protein